MIRHMCRLAPAVALLLAAMLGLNLSGQRTMQVTAAAPAPITVVLAPDPSLPASVVSDAEISRTAQALQDWANVQVAQAWNLPDVTVLAVSRGQSLPQAGSHTWILHLMDSTDVYGALGYHTVDNRGVPWGEIGVEDSIAYDGDWTICASHELAELLVDPFANRVAFDAARQATPGDSLQGWMLEVADPVETSHYLWGDRGIAYQVSDFAYPSEFTAGARYPFDKLHLLHAPFSTTHDGTLARFTVSQTITAWAP